MGRVVLQLLPISTDTMRAIIVLIAVALIHIQTMGPEEISQNDGDSISELLIRGTREARRKSKSCKGRKCRKGKKKSRKRKKAKVQRKLQKQEGLKIAKKDHVNQARIVQKKKQERLLKKKKKKKKKKKS